MSEADPAAVEAERARRAAFLEQARDMTPYVAAAVGAELFVVRTDDEGLGRDVFVRRKRNDMGILKGVVRRIRDERVDVPAQPAIVDVGANIGTTTVLALRRHGFASGTAIEPSPATFRVLRLNIAVNDLEDRVRTVWAAASDRDGRVELAVPADSGRARVAPAGREPRHVTVTAVTLDSLVARGLVDPERTGLLWIDVQGHEAHVVSGASRLLDAAVPLVLTIRPGAKREDGTRPWVAPADVRAVALEKLRSGYSDVFELRKRPGRTREAQPVDALDALVDSFADPQDLLLIRR